MVPGRPEGKLTQCAARCDNAVCNTHGDGFPAKILGLRDRGLVNEEYVADLVVFDVSRIGDRSTYGDPHQYSEGIHWVLVNGKVVLENGAPNGVRAGQVLLKRDG